MSCADFADHDQQGRLVQAIEIARAAGLDRRLALTAIAISITECSVEWVKPRENLFFQVPCYTCRTCVGIEPFHLSGVKMWRPTVTQEPAVVEWMKTIGLIAQNEQGQRGSSGAVYYRIPDMMLAPSNGHMVAAAFELMLAAREASMLAGFSLGPTQMWLAQTAPSLEYQDRHPLGREGGVGHVQAFPQTWEAIAETYFSRSIPEVMSHLGYLEAQWMPVDAPTDRERRIEYIRRKQTGGTFADAEAYDTAHFAANLDRTLRAARSVGW